ncbi:MAG TPA: formate/nitrite family transporter [Dehalococcoidia bacterium]|nr:formate/nitrite family transporter [Dehalococcoidia bacterium]
MADPPAATFDALLPPQIAEACERVGAAKARMDLLSTLVLAGLAGAFISLGAMLFTVTVTEAGLGFGPTRLLGGVAFSLGLVLVVIAGAELFTGNTLIIMAWASRKVSTPLLLRNWGLVYAGNFAGALLTVLLVYASQQFEFNGDQIGATALKVANNKVNLGFGQAVALGILCNALVTLAVWLALSARGSIDKIVSIVFPITAFVAAGFEHSVANMYFIPMGVLLKEEPSVREAAGLSGGALSDLTWGDFLLANLLPVTIGNIIGGALLVGAVYWFVYLRRDHTASAAERAG